LCNNRGESLGLMHSQVGQNLAVHFDAGFGQRRDEARIGHFRIDQTDGCVDPLDPQGAEVALAVLAVAGGVLVRLSTACVAVRKLRERAP
jgi:hypothetical protein